MHDTCAMLGLCHAGVEHAPLRVACEFTIDAIHEWRMGEKYLKVLRLRVFKAWSCDYANRKCPAKGVMREVTHS